MVFIVTKSARVQIVFNDNEQAIQLKLFELIMEQAAKDGCSKLRMSVRWDYNRLEITLHDDCCEGFGHDKFDARSYDIRIPKLAEHLQELLSDYDVTITHEVW